MEAIEINKDNNCSAILINCENNENNENQHYSSSTSSTINLVQTGVNDSTLEIVQQKFRREETVLALFEAYQINGNETPDRLLALIKSNETYAIFSFAVTCLPPKNLSDFTIKTIFPINDDFQIQTECKRSIAKLQFIIMSTNGPSVFYYYPYNCKSLNDFNAFHKKIQLVEKQRLKLLNNKIQLKITANKIKNLKINNRNMIIYCNNDDNDDNDDNYDNNYDNDIRNHENFKWLNFYRSEDDYLAIDRCIADGTKPLKKGESKFQDELKKYEHEYIVYKKYRIYCATWNINGQSCNEKSLKSWLATDQSPDIYAIAFQELDLSPKAITFNETRPDPIWIRKVMDNLHSDVNYEELISVRLVGMMLTIIVRNELRPNVTRCSTQTVGTGALNFMGNKGGVGVSLTINEADICFVNSHLAAHLHEVERRNEDFAEIIRRLQFGDTYSRLTIDQHDHIFWIGDLNYRIDEKPGQNIDYNNFNELLKYDQLRNEMDKKRVFNGYTEGEIKFRPTYKYDPGTDEWDSSEKNRAPAWCDRILWKGDRIEQITYKSVMEIRLSDHKPVYAIFLTGIKTKDEQKYKRVHEEVLKRVDKYENDNQPQITVEKTDIDFDIISFNELSIRDFTVANNCHLPVKFSFKSKNENDRICEDWLDVEPKSGNLITGTSLSIRIKLLVDSHSVWRLHNKQKKHVGKIPLDILVLHVEDGRDIFITIMGEYKPSCFGFNVDTLSRTISPINDLTLIELINIENSLGTIDCQVKIPREIFLLIDYLYKNINLITTSSLPLFTIERKYSKNPNINEIRDWLDCWSTKEFPGTPHTAAEALLMLLESSPEPLIHPFEEQILKSTDNIDQIIQNLTITRKLVFLYICIFLRDGIQQKIFNVNDIATIFGNVLLKRHDYKLKNLINIREDDQKRTVFMMNFLTKHVVNFARTEFKFIN